MRGILCIVHLAEPRVDRNKMHAINARGSEQGRMSYRKDTRLSIDDGMVRYEIGGAVLQRSGGSEGKLEAGRWEAGWAG